MARKVNFSSIIFIEVSRDEEDLAPHRPKEIASNISNFYEVAHISSKLQSKKRF